MDLLCTKYSRAEISHKGIYRRETPPTPREAVREAVLNAVAHRDYANAAPIRIRVYNHRVELWNPGSLPLDWTLDKLVGTHASAPHNPAIANVFFRAGMVEAWGRGIGNIVSACGSAGSVEPQWQLEPGGLRLEFVFTAGDHETPGQGMPQETPSGDRRTPESRPESLVERVLQQLAHGPMPKADLSRALGQQTIPGHLNTVIRSLMADGSIGYTIPERPRSRLQM